MTVGHERNDPLSQSAIPCLASRRLEWRNEQFRIRCILLGVRGLNRSADRTQSSGLENMVAAIFVIAAIALTVGLGFASLIASFAKE